MYWIYVHPDHQLIDFRFSQSSLLGHHVITNPEKILEMMANLGLNFRLQFTHSQKGKSGV